MPACECAVFPKYRKQQNQLIYKTMKKGIKLFSAAILGLAAVACSSPQKMAEMAESVIVKCEPAVLEVVGGEIDATITVTYPEKYFNAKAILEVTPVVVYEGGEAKMDASYSRARKFRTTTRLFQQTERL